MRDLSAQCANLYKAVGAHLQAGRLREAAFACRELCEQFPGFAGGWHAGSVVAQRLGNMPKALECIERAIAIEPERNAFRLQQAQVLLYLAQFERAKSIAAALAPHCTDDPALCAALGNFHMLAQEHERAESFYRRAAELDPNNSDNWFNLASTQRFLGQLAQAERSFDTALQLNPRSYEAYYLRAGLRRQSAQSNHIAQMEGLVGPSLQHWPERDWKGAVQLCYALGKEYEDLGDYNRAFGYLKQGADMKRAHMQYNVADDLRAIDAIIDTYSPAVCAAAVNGCPSREPIFIIGLPRTGTTLVERILTSHSAVFSAGELNNFAVQLTALLQAAAGAATLSKEQMIAASPQLDFAQLGSNYLDSTRPLTGATPHFVDKMPLNYLYCGLIAKALPHARIIELVRHPLDTCYSIYKQLFTLAYPFSYNLDELADYYLAYVKLMNHWHAALPGRIHRVYYEQLVDNQEDETRRLLQFCDLEWQDSCLAFEKNHRASTTASAAQVREPVYRSSVDKWRQVQHHLQPIQTKLRAHTALFAADWPYAIE